MSLKAVYISAGTDLVPVHAFTKTREFIYIDRKLPSKKIMQIKGFECTGEIENTYMLFVKGAQAIKYYRCDFPIKMNDSLRQDLLECNAIIFNDNNQDSTILDYIQSKPMLIISMRVSEYNPCYMKSLDRADTLTEIYMCREPYEKKEGGKMVPVYEIHRLNVKIRHRDGDHSSDNNRI